MEPRTGILAAGNWIVDKLKVVDVYPRQDALANILSESVGNGGSPFNVLVDLARLGAPFPLSGLGLVGDDADGAWIQKRCAAHGIDATGIRPVSGAHTSYTDVMTVRSTGRRTFFHQRGANALLDEEHFDFGASRAKIFHLGYLLLLDRLDGPHPQSGTVGARVLELASRAGCRTSIDVVSEDGDRFGRVVLPALRHTDYCIVNDFEAERTTGVPLRPNGGPDPAALREASARLLAAGVRELAVIHFPEGATALGRDGVFHQQGSVRIAQADIVSTVGAGDAFAAGVLHALHEELPVADALRHGASAAAACLRGAGTSDGVRPLAECLALADRLGFRPDFGPA